MAYKTYSPAQQRHAAKLVRKYGVTGAVERLNANAGSQLASERSSRLFPNRTNIAAATVSKFAKERGIELRRGRRPLAMAV